MKNLSLKEIEKEFGLPVRKVAFLIRKGIINSVVDGGKILLTDAELMRYFDLSETEKKKHHVSYLKTLGPGLVTGASDDDPSGIGTYSTAGSTYGLSLNWLALYLLPMMTAVQETVARIGIVTGKGLSGAIGKQYGRKILYPLVILLVVANTINIGADIGAMVASAQLLVPVNFYLGAIILTLFMLLLEIKFSYHRYSKILKWLTASLLGYIVTMVIIKPDWVEVAKSLVVPTIQFNAGFIATMVAVMGTTISPYLFFWQASEEVEEEKDKGVLSDHRTAVVNREIKEMRKDTIAGMSYATIVFFSIVVTTAFVLNEHGITNIESAAQAAAALEPLAGQFASLLFTVGIFGVGLLAVPVLAGASAYGIAELFKWHEGLSKKYSQAKGFYGVIVGSMIIGLLMNFIGINPIKALYWAAVVNGVVAPILMYFIFKIGSDKKIMGDHTSPRWVRLWGWTATILMGTAAIVMFVLLALGK
jgi:NRAMP (natural resistance-associated macrophage protein)-like metal ion transporter